MIRRFPLHVHISTLFITLILLIGGVIAGLGVKNSRDMIESAAEELNIRISRETLSEFTNTVGPAEMATRLLSHDAITQAKSLPERLRNIGFMREALNNSQALTALYVGYANGDFFMMRRLWNDADRQSFNAPAESLYLVQSIEHQGDRVNGRYIFLDAKLTTLRNDEQPTYAANFDPRQRDWYTAAQKAEGQVKTPPYLFFTNRNIGVTIANRAHGVDAVVGADIRLETLSASLSGQKMTPGSHVLLINNQTQVIAFEDFSKALKYPTGPDTEPVLAKVDELGIPALTQLAPRLKELDTSTGAKNFSLTVNEANWHVSIRPTPLEGAGQLFLITATPDDELMAAANRLLRHSLIATGLIILLALPITWVLARNISGALGQLAKEAEAIRGFDFSQPIKTKSLVLEVNDLAQTMGSMKRTIRRFLDISLAVAAEPNFDRLLPRLLTETISAAEADGGLLYLADNEILTPAIGLKSDGTELILNQTLISAASGPLLGAALSSGKPHTAALAAADIAALDLAPILQSCPASHAIAVPLLNRDKVLVGAVLLLCQDDSDAGRLSFIEAISGSAAVSLENKELIKAQKLLFAAFIQLIAGAIDAKSPYTGGHCARVPELTKMLARAACNEKSGPYQDFQLSEEEWEAVHVAAWLHDCGKVTTPEYVIDKATKLETLYNRIHEIRMRFEVLKRDAEIASLNSIANGEPAALAQTKLQQLFAQIDDDYAFIASCNQGGEFMAADKQARLADIANQTWMRTLDDRIGISHEELERKNRTPATTLPFRENVLADKPEHLFERRPQDRMPANNKLGIRMPMPELLYNKGECYNLSVARGTLSGEERYKINEHIVQTLIMLSQLPFPKHLRQVPEIAGGHHEKMDGTGYPRQLHQDEMSPVARMMAIADIFEALTAIDRPYKKGKTLSETLRIMSGMKNEGHIDPELFDLFLKSGVYREYAERFLLPSQIDGVDITAYLAVNHPA